MLWIRRVKGLLTLTAAKATETHIFFHQEWVTLDLMEVFTWRPMTKAMATHSAQYNPFFLLSLPQSVWTSLKHLAAAMATLMLKMPLPCEHIHLLPWCEFVTSTTDDTKIMKIMSLPSQCELIHLSTTLLVCSHLLLYGCSINTLKILQHSWRMFCFSSTQANTVYCHFCQRTITLNLTQQDVTLSVESVSAALGVFCYYSVK